MNSISFFHKLDTEDILLASKIKLNFKSQENTVKSLNHTYDEVSVKCCIYKTYRNEKLHYKRFASIIFLLIIQFSRAFEQILLLEGPHIIKPHASINTHVVFDKIRSVFDVQDENLISDNSDIVIFNFDEKLDGNTIKIGNTLLCQKKISKISDGTHLKEEFVDPGNCIWNIKQNSAGFNIYKDVNEEVPSINTEQICLIVEQAGTFKTGFLNFRTCDINDERMIFYILKAEYKK